MTTLTDNEDVFYANTATNTTNPPPPPSKKKKKKKKARAEQQWTLSISRKRWLKLSRFLSGPDVPYSKTASWFVDLIEDWENASEW